MILLDELNTHLRQQQRVIAQVARILSQIGPDERVAVFTLGKTLRAQRGCSFEEGSKHTKVMLGAKVTRMPRHPSQELKTRLSARF